MNELNAKEITRSWTCPRCGAQLSAPEEPHDCGLYSESTLFSSGEPQVYDLYRSFKELVKQGGYTQVFPMRTKIDFVSGSTFVTVIPEKDHLTVTFLFREPDRSPRFTRIEQAGPGEWLHAVRVDREGDFDAEFNGWLERARGSVTS